MSALERGMFKKRKLDAGGSSGKITEISDTEETAPSSQPSLNVHDITVCKHILDVCFRRGIPCDGGSLAQLGAMYDAFKQISNSPSEKGKESGEEVSLNVGMIMTMIQFIDLAAKAGTINAKEMKLVGHVYGNLEAFVQAYQATRPPATTTKGAGDAMTS